MTTPTESEQQAALVNFLGRLAAAADEASVMQEPMQALANDVAAVMERFEREVSSRYSDRRLIFYGSRPSRVFNVECQRLRYRATCALVDGLYDGQLKGWLERLESVRKPVTEAELRAALGPLAEQLSARMTHVVPALGEHLYLYIYDLMIGSEAAWLIQQMATEGIAPPQLGLACLSVFALVDQARAVWQPEAPGEAYSFLLDANHMLGMQEGAKFAMRRVPAIAPRLQGAKGGKRANDSMRVLRERAHGLFFELQPRGADGQVVLWKSKDQATKTIWDFLVKEAHRDGHSLTRGHAAVRSVCEKLLAPLKAQQREARRQGRSATSAVDLRPPD
jgi:hypothetical protein